MNDEFLIRAMIDYEKNLTNTIERLEVQRQNIRKAIILKTIIAKMRKGEKERCK